MVAAAMLPATVLLMLNAVHARNVPALAVRRQLLARRKPKAAKASMKAVVITKAAAVAPRKLLAKPLISARVVATAARAAHVIRVVPAESLVAMATRHAADSANIKLLNSKL